MGRFYGSIHVRGAGYDKVCAACTELANKLKCEFLLAPEIGGWISAYPSNSGQDETVSREIASLLPGETLHVFLHDDDIFSYLYFRDGSLADEYNSDPDYFGKASPNARKVLRGTPEAFSGALSDPECASLGDLLHSDDRGPFFAVEAFERFAALLGLPNACTCYEYLMSGDTRGIEGWAKFAHVPDRSAEVKAQEKAAETLNGFRRKGVLLLEQSPAPLAICPDGTSGFFASRPWPDGSDWPELSRFAPPWSNGRTAAGLAIGRYGSPMCTSASGRYLAAGAGLWDAAEQRRIAEVEPAVSIYGLGFTQDEKTLVTWSVPRTDCSQEVLLTSVPGGRRVRTLSLGQPGPASLPIALHPSGQILLGSGPSHALNAISLSTGATVRTFYAAPTAVPFKISDEQRNMMRQRLENLANPDSEAAKSLQQQFRLSKDEVPGFVKDFAQDLEGWRKRSEARGPQPSEQPCRVLFSQNGRLLFCVTDKGLRIFDWEPLLASAEESPAPRFRLDLETPDFDASAWKGAGIAEAWKKHDRLRQQKKIFALAEDPRRNLLLFGTGGGKIGAVDLETGSDRTLLTIPGEMMVSDMGLSTDGAVLYTKLRPASVEVGLKNRSRLLLWDYDRLTLRPDQVK